MAVRKAAKKVVLEPVESLADVLPGESKDPDEIICARVALDMVATNLGLGLMAEYTEVPVAEIDVTPQDASVAGPASFGPITVMMAVRETRPCIFLKGPRGHVRKDATPILMSVVEKMMREVVASEAELSTDNVSKELTDLARKNDRDAFMEMASMVIPDEQDRINCWIGTRARLTPQTAPTLH